MTPAHAKAVRKLAALGVDDVSICCRLLLSWPAVARIVNGGGTPAAQRTPFAVDAETAAAERRAAGGTVLRLGPDRWAIGPDARLVDDAWLIAWAERRRARLADLGA